MVFDFIRVKEKQDTKKTPSFSEKELCDQLRDYQMIMDLAPDPMVIIQDRKIAWGNKRAVEMTGYDLENLVGSDLLQFIAKKHKGVVLENYLAGMSGIKTAQGYEVEIITRSGKKIPAEINAKKINYKGATATLVIFRDITDRKKIHKDLVKSEQRLRDIVYASTDWVWEVDKKLRYTYVSSNVKEVIGYTSKEMMGKTPLDFLVETEMLRTKEQFANALKDKKSIIDFEHWHRHKKGYSICMQSNILPIIGRKGNILGFRGVEKDITGRIMIEANLRSSKKFSEKLLSIAGVMLVVLDKDGKVKLFNRRAEEITGFNSYEVLDKNWFDIFVPTERKEELKKVFVQNLQPSSASNEYTNIILTKEGKERLILWHNISLQDERGVVIGTLSSGEDITEMHNVLRKLEQSESMYKDLARLSPDIMYRLDEKGNITYVNEIVTRYGYLPENLIGKNMKILVHEKDLPVATEKHSDCVKNGKPIENFRFRLKSKDKRTYYGELNGIPLYSEGEIVGSQGVLRDVTERVESEKRIQASEGKYKALFENANDAVFIEKLDGTILEVNEKACSLLGYHSQELVGHSVFEIVPQSISSDLENLIKKLLDKKALRIETKNIRKDGSSVDVEVSLSLVTMGKINRIVAVVRDITHIKHHQEEIKKREQALGAVLEGIKSPCVAIDTREIYLFGNTSFTKLLDIQTADLVGKPLQDIFLLGGEVAQVHKKEGLEVFKGALSSQKAQEKTYRSKKKWYRLEVFPAPFGAVGLMVDITDIKNTEETLRTEKEEVEKLNKILVGRELKMIELKEEVDRLKGINKNITL